MEHITVDKKDVEFPLWAKVFAGLITLGVPIFTIGSVWVGGVLWDMSVRIARMEVALDTASEDRYRASQAVDAHSALELKIESNEREIRELQRVHGRGS